MSPDRRSREPWRFLVARIACTLATYLVYLLLLRWLDYGVAYALSYVFGIALAYVASARFVFDAPLRARAALQFPLVYLLQFAGTYVLLRCAVDLAGMRETHALAIAMVAFLPLSFTLSRRIVRGPATADG